MREDGGDGDGGERGAPGGAATSAAGAPAPAPRRMGPLARTLLLGLATALAFLVGAAATAVVTSDGGVDPPPVADEAADGLEGRIAPDTAAPLPDTTLEGFAGGEPVALDAYRGQPLIVNFWASWCAPCVKEMPDFETVSRDLAGVVPVLGVNVQDAPANAEAFAEELGITYDLATDPKGELYAAVDAFGMPTTLFVDAQGVIRYRYTGTLDADELRDLVATHLDVDA
jgi:cytochrome c biogenesis protein CcmG, thiol:disulfide interchange protein DsbE